MNVNMDTDTRKEGFILEPEALNACVSCGLCLLRKKGFEEAEIEDPLWRK